MTNNINIAEYFSDEKSKRAATVDVFESIMKVLFFYFEEDQENLDEEGEMEIFTDYLWDITVSAMSSVGINIVGKDEDGNYIAKLRPPKSVKQFLMTEDIGKEDHVYYEDYLDDIGRDSAFGLHDDKIIKI